MGTRIELLGMPAGAENDVRNGKAAPIGEIYNASRDILREG